MAKRVFIPCINKEPKIYNFNYGTIAGAAICLLFVGLSKGLLWGLGAAAIGATIGGWLSKQWYLGKVQQNFYWYLPNAQIWIDKNIPDSSKSHEM